MFISLSPIQVYKAVLLVAYGCLLIALSAFKSAELFLPTIYQLEAFFGGDKLMHLKLSIGLSYLALFALVNTSDSIKLASVLWRAFAVCMLLISGLLLDELHQALVSTRRFEWWDLAYGMAGIGIGFVVYIWGFLLRVTIKR